MRDTGSPVARRAVIRHCVRPSSANSIANVSAGSGTAPGASAGRIRPLFSASIRSAGICVDAEQHERQVVAAGDDRVAERVLADGDVALAHRQPLPGEADQRQQLVPVVAEPADGVLHVCGDLAGLLPEIGRLAGVAQRPLQRSADLVLVGLRLRRVALRLGERIGDLLPILGVEADQQVLAARPARRGCRCCRPAAG